RVVDAQDQALSRGQIGHVQVRGPNVLQGYWRNPGKTATDFTSDGYFRTGDDGFIDDEDYLNLAGRAKDLVITGGLNVYPSEVELALDELPNVIESAVVGLPHADFGEQVVAYMVLKDPTAWDELGLRELVRAQLAAYKCPKQYFIVAELPRNAMGKVQKNILRQSAQN
ncbi:MAG: AMP-binding protein, partial [Burkholderiales bacterium]|nr:AMP-binding protein [Burkholderiales bacterium]